MKILRINKFYYLKGGAERHYFALSRLLAEHGHEMIPFSMRDRRNEPTAYADFFIKNIDYTVFSLKNIGKFFYNREAVRNLEALIAREKPDLAHLHNIYHQLTPAIIDVLKKHGIPVVMTLHDLKVICPHYNILLADKKMCCNCAGGKFYRHLLGSCARRSLKDFMKGLLLVAESYYNARRYSNVDVFIVPSLFFKHTLEQFGFAGRVEYLPHFYEQPADTAVSSTRSLLPTDRPYVLYSGRLSDEKGVHTLLYALQALHLILPQKPTHLVIAGDGPKRQFLERLAVTLGLTEHVTFTGHLTLPEVYACIAGAQAVVVPSECFENAPNSVAEAMLLTTPVICAKVGGLTDMVVDGVTGFFFEPADADSLALCMKKVLYELPSQRRDAIVRAAASSLQTTRDSQTYYRQIMEIYHSIMKV